MTWAPDSAFLAIVEPKVHHCPRCGAPLTVHPGAWAVRCNFCQVDVSLLGPAQTAPQSAVTKPDAPPPPPSPAAILRGKILFAIYAALFGLLTLPTFYYLDRYDATSRAPVIAVVASILGFLVYGSGRRKLGTIPVILVGLVFLLKPFVRPVVYDNHTLSLTSETHLYFLIPGLAMPFVFGGMLLSAFDPNHAAPKDSRMLRVIVAMTFAAGIAMGYYFFGGPTIRDVIEMHRPDGTAMRQKFSQFASRLPPVGDLQTIQEKLSPTPVWYEDRALQNNIDIVTVDELLNIDESPKYGNLYLSSEIMYAVHWTGPKNPMASYLMGEPAEDLSRRLQHSFQLPWLAAYRPGKNGIDVFVYDLRAGKIVTSLLVTGTKGDYSTDRRLVVEGLAKATGGTFVAK